MINQARDQIQVEAATTFLTQPTNFVGAIPAGETTPSVLNLTRFTTQNEEAVTITDFLKGAEGQEIIILGDGFTTLDHGTNIFCLAGEDLLLAADTAYAFVKINSKWYQH